MQGQNLAQGWRGRDGEEENTLCRAWEEKEKSTRSVQESREDKHRDWAGWHRGLWERAVHTETFRVDALHIIVGPSHYFVGTEVP